MKDKQNFGMYVVMISISLLFLSLIGMFVLNTLGAEAAISVRNIDYVNVSPSSCWDDDIDPAYCPLPRDIELHLKIKDVRKILSLVD